MKGYHHLTLHDRKNIERMYNNGDKKPVIAHAIGCSLQTIYNELKRGMTVIKKSSYADWAGDHHYKMVPAYSSYIAQEAYELGKSAHGAPIKLANHYDYCAYIEKRVLEDKLSPCAVLGEINRKNLFPLRISKTTLYRYISMGFFEHLTRMNTPYPRRKTHHRIHVAKRPPRGTSIEQRPAFIGDRSTFGHWEMDLVVGPQRCKGALLVLTERRTRYEYIVPIPNKKPSTVVSAMDGIQRKLGSRFSNIFQSITVDNGVEFSDSYGLEHDDHGKLRTRLYYCHPYTSSERGSNERINRDIRRVFPKGTDFATVHKTDITRCATWLNNYPRKLHNYATPAEQFHTELVRLCIQLKAGVL